jgi:anti-sigma B factor antagonist
MRHPSAAPLQITTCGYGSTQTITVRGELYMAVSDQIGAAVRAALAEAPEIVVLDLSALGFIDVAGVRAVLGAHRHAQARCARMMIIAARPGVQRVFTLCGVESALPFAAAAATRDALASRARSGRFVRSTTRSLRPARPAA